MLAVLSTLSERVLVRISGAAAAAELAKGADGVDSALTGAGDAEATATDAVVGAAEPLVPAAGPAVARAVAAASDGADSARLGSDITLRCRVLNEK